MIATIRSPQPGDLDQIAAISRTWYPERQESPEAWLKHRDDPGHYVADAGNEVAGYARMVPDPLVMPGEVKFRLHLGVLPSYSGCGIGTQLYRCLVQEARTRGAGGLRIRLRSTQPGSIGFFERRGFAVMQRMVNMALDLGSLKEPPPWPAVPGITLTTLAEELKGRPNCLRAVHDLRNLCFTAVPTADRSPLPEFEAFSRLMEEPNLRPDMFFLAKDGERYIGLSNMATGPDGQTLDHHFTGVDPAYRRRGVASALKALTVRLALDGGYKRIVTGTNALNAGMLAVNRALGFVETYTEVRLGREIEPNGSCPDI